MAQPIGLGFAVALGAIVTIAHYLKGAYAADPTVAKLPAKGGSQLLTVGLLAAASSLIGIFLGSPCCVKCWFGLCAKKVFQHQSGRVHH